MDTTSRIVRQVTAALEGLESLGPNERIDAINQIKLAMRRHSPLSQEPVDCVLWLKTDEIQANDYNPNNVAPPELRLLEISIREDGFTQPIVVWRNEGGKKTAHEVVDGFHRNLIGRRSSAIHQRTQGRLPVVVVNQDRQDRSDRIAATIRHNRARGRHSVDLMSEIVVELRNRNRSEAWIAEHLGMDEDEVLRLTQISGLTSMFADREFSTAWEAASTEQDKSPTSRRREK